MSPRSHAKRSNAPTSRGYAKLEGRLVLLSWLHRQLGYENTRDLLNDIKHINEGYDQTGCTYICTHLTSRSNLMSGVIIDDLQRYDDNIRSHLASINARRAESITLRYFQYLAALYTEIYLDWYFNRPEKLLGSLNKYVIQHNKNCAPDRIYERFERNDIAKLAFWMATGSGKTLLLHLNYRQFSHYNRQQLDNILLITPNEGLSKQHFEELQTSHIPALRYEFNEMGEMLKLPGTIMVTEITKLVETRKGGGKRVPVDAFDGYNLIFVDEGHKGAGGEAWRGVRDALAKTGFTFEYSATFGQALAAANDDKLLTEYGKSIAFDYSYRHFYSDGYGKDFHILNLQQEESTEQTHTLMMANLLSFYEQQLVFVRQGTALRPYNLSRPLWTFVGGSVNAVSESGQLRSDILTVARFLHRVLSDRSWAIHTIRRLLNGQSGLKDNVNGRDIFDRKFEYLRRRDLDAVSVYQDVLQKVMHTNSSGGLQLCDLRRCDGELGLKATSGDSYFGLIYIGETGKFKSLVETNDLGIVVTDDVLHGSLFDLINEPNSTLEILVGARKFIEGWNSWRVSNMGLLNMGRSEGSQIIQLFGRGVRLRGRDMTLKRSSALNDELHPRDIGLLETLNIFALRANYMDKFRDYLESEGIDTLEPVELPLFILPNNDFLDKGLVIPRVDEGKSFPLQETVLLKFDSDIKPISVVMSTTVQQISSGQGSVTDSGASSGIERTIPPKSLELVDWDKVYLALLEYKESRDFSNLLVRPGLLRPILQAQQLAYRLVAEESIISPRSYDDQQRLQETVTNILRKYADSLYRSRILQWESSNLIYRQLDYSDDNFRFNTGERATTGRYIVKVPRGNMDVVHEIEQLLADCNDLYLEDQGSLPRIHFDRHLYQPLLVETDNVLSSPPGLRESERRFVADLKEYCANTSANSDSGTELFLLRNLSRGKGVGFFGSSGFYPDFILWIKTKNQQRIIFIEPHGMLHQKAYEHDEKARLHERLPELARKIADHSGNPNVRLDSFIISATSYEDLWERYDNGKWSKEDFAAKNILFQEYGREYIAHILQR